MPVKLPSLFLHPPGSVENPLSLVAPVLGDDGKWETIKTSLIGVGFQPTFYQFTDTIIEVKMAISMNKTTETEVSVSASSGWGPFSASVNASYSSKYSYSVEGSSLLRTKITPLPPNAFMQRILDMKAQMLQQEFAVKMKATEVQLELDRKAKELEMQQKEKDLGTDPKPLPPSS